MKQTLLSLLFVSMAMTGFTTTWVINNSGFTFNPATLTITEGDSVMFDIDGIHNSVEVSMVVWNANGNTPLSGGWSTPFGGGLVLPAKLTVGTHFYVCNPHASMGMKGMIIVENTTSVAPEPFDASVSVYPNPSDGNFQISVEGTSGQSGFHLEIFDIHGKKVHAERSLEQETRIELYLSDLGKGIYFVKLNDGNRSCFRKVLLQ